MKASKWRLVQVARAGNLIPLPASCTGVENRAQWRQGSLSDKKQTAGTNRKSETQTPKEKVTVGNGRIASGTIKNDEQHHRRDTLVHLGGPLTAAH